jgi:apolipoprotein N-acyltransferase
VLDPLGRTIDSLPLGTEGVLDARLPQPAALTPYARTGDLPTGLALVLAAAVAMRKRRGPSVGAAKTAR